VKICKRCVMDPTATDWVESVDGCNYCDEFVLNFPKLSGNQRFSSEEVESNLIRLKNRIIQNKKRSESSYDCVIGLSGGLDSSYALVLAAELGINPLVVHMDNGWNSELAQNNIEGLINHFGFDFETHVIDWDEYRDLQRAFFEADVVDIEMLYDMAAVGVCFKAARKYGIYTIVAGTNSATEGMRMPPTWSYRNKLDKRNLRDIVKKHGENVAFKTFPIYSSFDQAFDLLVRRIEWVSILDLVNYEKKDAEQKLVASFGFKPYPFKHYESVFTRFYQGFILPNKFGIDKRKSHLSTLIMTNQLSRAQAVDILSQSPYPTEEMLEKDLDYFLKRMGWSKSDLSAYLERPIRPHSDFKSEEEILRLLKFIYFATRSTYYGFRRALSRTYYGFRRALSRTYYGFRRALSKVFLRKKDEKYF
jgi:N-acetyl sugar amidotransferase